MPASFRLKFASRGCGVTTPVTFKEPASLIFASSATLKALARSRLAPITLTDRGAISTFAAGLVRRSSAETLASRIVNSRRSNCQAGAGAAPAPADALSGGEAGDTGGEGEGGGDGAGE